jgi:hypothetical protein
MVYHPKNPHFFFIVGAGYENNRYGIEFLINGKHNCQFNLFNAMCYAISIMTAGSDWEYE